jgi:hypothetical protein
MKSRKKTPPALNEDLTRIFLYILNTIKLFHWKTTSYALHKATDDLHGKLSGLVDSFVEVMLGKTEGGRLNRTVSFTLKHCKNIGEFNIEIRKFRDILINVKFPQSENSDLYTIRDEMLKELNQFLYLSTFI